MTSTKKVFRAINTSQVGQIFDDACIEELARIAKLASNSDRQRFAESIREAARIYAGDVREPNANELHAQIADLHNAAKRLQYDRVAALIEALSPKALDLLNKGVAGRIPAIDLPPQEALRDYALREKACVTVASLCRVGRRIRKGRMRPTGKRSMSVEWMLYAPLPRRHIPKRQAELDFVMHLQLAWVEATAKKPPLAANPDRLGPFGRMVQACLKLIGAGYSVASVAGHINELNSRRAAYPVRDQL